MQTLWTWAGRSKFSYTGSVIQGTKIFYGKGYSVNISANHYNAMLNYFRGRTIDIGTSRNTPPENSVGGWLQVNITQTAIASYVGAILVYEGYAIKADKGPKIKFKEFFPLEM